ncbi:Aminotransferase class-III (plasmid) [Mesorhizobium loti]|nr:Aminotransferase class-III [Mesorhizobium loti]
MPARPYFRAEVAKAVRGHKNVGDVRGDGMLAAVRACLLLVEGILASGGIRRMRFRLRLGSLTLLY